MPTAVNEALFAEQQSRQDLVCHHPMALAANSAFARQYRSQQGQVMVLGLFLAAALGLAWMHYFSTGQTVAAKARMIHGLDAAAYSGALVQAQTLNLLAYVNRAQRGHQLAMAHLLTLASWAHFAGTEADRLGRANPPQYLIGMLFGAAHGQAYQSAARAAGLQHQMSASGPAGQAFAAHNNFVHGHAKELSQALKQGLPAARMAAIEAVLQAHYPELSAADLKPVIHGDQWPQLLVWRKPDAVLHEWIKTGAELYGFLQQRNHTARNNWLVQSRCPGRRHELRRRGDTELDASGRWQSADTQSFHALRSNRWIGCYYREYPMGWAWMPAQAGRPMQDEHSESPPEDFSQQDFWRWVQASTNWDLVQGRSNPLANSYALRSRLQWPSHGLAAYQEIASHTDAEAVSSFALSLQLAGNDGLVYRAFSAAETYFSRPAPRSDGYREVPNLFHPYWHARLSARLSQEPWHE